MGSSVKKENAHRILMETSLGMWALERQRHEDELLTKL
jgi:hypothetical protein